MPLTNPRIKPLPEAEWSDEVKAALAGWVDRWRRLDVDASNFFGAIARHPKFMLGFLPLAEFILLGRSTILPRHRELLILSTASSYRSEYVFGHHKIVGRKEGNLTDQDITRAVEGPRASGLDAFDRALLLAVEELYLSDHISDSTWTALAERYNGQQLVDVVATIGMTKVLCMMANSFGLQLEEGVTGFPEGGLQRERPRKGSAERVGLERPRIAPLSVALWDPELRQVLDAWMQRGARVIDKPIPNTFTTLANHPRFAVSSLRQSSYISMRGELTIPPRAREILILRTGWLYQSEYEFGQHKLIAKAEAGLTDEEIKSVMKGPRAPAWTPLEADLLQAADELYANAFITDGTWCGLASHYDEKQLMDVIAAVGHYNFLSKLLNSLGLQLEEGLTGFPDLE